MALVTLTALKAFTHGGQKLKVGQTFKADTSTAQLYIARKHAREAFTAPSTAPAPSAVPPAAPAEAPSVAPPAAPLSVEAARALNDVPPLDTDRELQTLSAADTGTLDLHELFDDAPTTPASAEPVTSHAQTRRKLTRELVAERERAETASQQPSTVEHTSHDASHVDAAPQPSDKTS